ncbi:helix-turn-helix domain-containing protein [Streptomyces sp. DHE17-7]|uniref:helix-turn-helix domain-containing protein n=1 Tax=Streptomyces sp. DHE17-7 TaxID=2759949 RepID=UPI003FA6D17B
MARRGRKRRLELEAEYWHLLAAGVGSVEACRQLGIGRKTGYRWRRENGGLQPDYLPEASRSGRYLSLLERLSPVERLGGNRLDCGGREGPGVREIAGLLGRAPSTVSRELRRNSRPHDYGRYDADLAHYRGRERAGRPRRSKLSTDLELKAEVQSKPRPGVESGADRRPSQDPLARPSRAAPLPRDHLPSPLPRCQGRLE